MSSRSGSDLGSCAVFAVSERSQVGEVRRAATSLAQRLGFDETEVGKAALVVTEAATNLIKHAGGGEVVLRGVEEGGVVGLDLLCLDRGSGMVDPARCLRDGYSTSGTPGTGLGAIGRLSDSFDLYSRPAEGTVLWSRLQEHPEITEDRLKIGAVHLPMPREEVCGDGWATEQRGDVALILVVDGLGHGPLAADAAREAIRVFREHATLDPVESVQRIHAALRSTRGAAAALAAVDFRAQELRFVGVGNIGGTLLSGSVSRSLVSHNGIVGHQARKIQAFTYEFPKGSLLVMHSDGLGSQWRLDRYPGLSERHPSLIAGVLYRDFKRGRDDVTVLAVREAKASGSSL